MERALSLELLSNALGASAGETHSRWPIWSLNDEEEDAAETEEAVLVSQSLLPSATQLQDLLAETEVGLFLHRRELSDELIRTAWYLHGVASADSAADLYSTERQRQAFAVSAHIFDLTLATGEREMSETLRMAFASQVGYHRSEAEPNAIAIARRLEPQLDEVLEEPDLPTQLPLIAATAGIAFLRMETRYLGGVLRRLRQRMSDLAQQIDVVALTDTAFEPTWCVTEAVWHLRAFLMGGQAGRLDQAQGLLDRAVTAQVGRSDVDACWVAAHLRFIADQMGVGTVWRLIPPNVPSAARQAFALTPPQVLTLWKPQRDLLQPRADDDHAGQAGAGMPLALDPMARRVVLSVPTSSGKTLLSQLMMVSHLATETSGVCYVSPLRSLGREVRRTLSRRLRALAREVGREQPDYGFPRSALIERILGAQSIDEVLDWSSWTSDSDVQVVTPERLMHALRDDAEEVLSRFGMFVFDEVHLLRDGARGFTLESVLAFLHWRTRETPHRIILLSAAMGNAGQLAAWLDVDGSPVLQQSEWRGPRRLTALFNTDISDWSNPEVETVRARGSTADFTERRLYPTYGLIRIKPAGRPTSWARTTASLGTTAIRARPGADARSGSDSFKDDSHSTPMYQMIAWLVRFVGEAGPVLVVRSTRLDAKRMAEAVAALVEEEYLPARPIAELSRIRLGNVHPLTGLLSKGVAYHHAGLPVELQEAIEDGVREERLRYVVATTTLTEGVNLPVRTVVLANVEYQGQPDAQQLRGARLVNAIGRAGRATKETEGWVVLATASRPLDADFSRFAPTQDELEVRSPLVADNVLELLEAYEAVFRDAEDIILVADRLRREAGEHDSPQALVADFVSYIWMVLGAEEELGRVGVSAQPLAAFMNTLAYTQLPEAARERFVSLISAVTESYEATEPGRRRRWAKTGTTVATARSLDELALQLSDAVLRMDPGAASLLDDPQNALEFLADLGVYEVLLDLPERPRDLRVHETTSGLSPEVLIDPLTLLTRWTAGTPLPVLADALLGSVSDVELRLERLVDTVTDFCEHYFAWMLGALLRLANGRLTEAAEDGEPPRRICPELPVYVRFGVMGDIALELVLSGVRSRELAARVETRARDAGTSRTDLRRWLSQMSIPEWAEQFDTSAPGLLDLIEYCRVRRAGVLRDLLRDGSVLIPTSSLGPLGSAGDVETGSRDRTVAAVLRRLDEVEVPSPIGVFTDGEECQLLLTVPMALHGELEAVLETGFDLDVSLGNSGLSIQLREA